MLLWWEFYTLNLSSISKNDDGDEIVYNNINKCLCCGHKSHSGIVKSFSLGKDEGTALIAQTLYEALDNDEPGAKKTRRFL